MSKLAGGEQAAFEKLVQATRHGQEAATELAAFLGDTRWMKVAMLFQELHKRIHELRIKRAVN